jgi:hypothetical protein
MLRTEKPLPRESGAAFFFAAEWAICLPLDVEFGFVAHGVLEGDAHDLLGARERLLHHGGAAEVAAFGIRDAPFAGLLADDEGPLAVGGEGEEGVGSGGNHQGTDLEVDGGDEGGGGIGSSAPDFTVGDEAAHDLASAHGGGAVVDGDGLAGEGDGGLGGR